MHNIGPSEEFSSDFTSDKFFRTLTASFLNLSSFETHTRAVNSFITQILATSTVQWFTTVSGLQLIFHWWTRIKGVNDVVVKHFVLSPSWYNRINCLNCRKLICPHQSAVCMFYRPVNKRVNKPSILAPTKASPARATKHLSRPFFAFFFRDKTLTRNDTTTWSELRTRQTCREQLDAKRHQFVTRWRNDVICVVAQTHRLFTNTTWASRRLTCDVIMCWLS